MEQSQLSAAANFAQGVPTETSPLSQSLRQNQPTRLSENLEAGRGSSTMDGDEKQAELYRSGSTMSQSNTLTPSRGGTLKKKQSLKKTGSLKRSSSRKSLRPGSVSSLALVDREKHSGAQGDELYSAFYTPVPTTGNPTEILADRFQAWRKVLKDLIAYYRDIQKSYEARSKSFLSVSNIINSTTAPPVFLTEGGLSEATQILRQYHKQSLAESNKARNIEEDVINQLAGLRSDLQQKIKEIKSLSGDFKNAVDKETESTRKAARALQEALSLADTDPSAIAGKNDPFIVRLSVERQVERQIDEENYLHRAFLNLENSGRELESIVVGEIQKAYNAYAGILRREADEAYDAVERLRTGPIALQKDLEWDAFVNNNDQFVDPELPIRKAERIHYPGKDAPAAADVRSGMLERKSKYLKSYTPGWYVLSATHLHEFKSADRMTTQSPVMSLYLAEQKLGSHSNMDSSSHKFMLKGRQTGAMHRGHGWVFRAESRETMLAWYEDIKSLTEKTGEERNAFVRRHARSVSGGSHKAGSVSSDGAMEEDEADAVPYSGKSSHFEHTRPQEAKLLERPQPGGRFPSDLNVNRGLQVPTSPSSGASSDEHDFIIPADLRTSRTLAEQPQHHEQRDKQVVSVESNTGRSTGIASTESAVLAVDHTLPISKNRSRQASYQAQPIEMTTDQEDVVVDHIKATSGQPELNSMGMVSRSGALSRHSIHQSENSEQEPVLEQAIEPSASRINEEPSATSELNTSPEPIPIIEGPYKPFGQSNASAKDLQNESYIPIPEVQDHEEHPIVQAYSQPTAEPSTFPEQNVQDPSPVSQPSVIPIHGAEYYTAAVESEGIRSDAPGEVAYAIEQHNPQADLTTLPELETFGDISGDQKSFVIIESPGATADALEESFVHQHPPKPSRPVKQPQSLLEPNLQIEPPTESQDLATAPIVARPPRMPTPPPVELGEFGSTPKPDNVTTFESHFKRAMTNDPGPSQSPLVERMQDEILPSSRPRITSENSVSTISNLHIPGEFPRSIANSIY